MAVQVQQLLESLQLLSNELLHINIDNINYGFC
jgi:hypothetical protein